MSRSLANHTVIICMDDLTPEGPMIELIENIDAGYIYSINTTIYSKIDEIKTSLIAAQFPHLFFLNRHKYMYVT